MLFCDTTKRKINESKPLPLPLTLDNIGIKSTNELLSFDSLEFLNFLNCDDADAEKSEKTQIIVPSIDIRFTASLNRGCANFYSHNFSS